MAGAQSTGGKSGGKAGGGKGGSASPAALHDDEDLMARRRVWKSKAKKHRNHIIEYSKSPAPPRGK